MSCLHIVNNKIMRNSILLYVRMGFVMILNLLSVRFVIEALGIEDYGIYDAVAGTVSLLSIVEGILSSAVQRYYSYALGENDLNKYNGVYVTSLNIFFVLGVFILLVSETYGLNFLNTQLIVPEEKIDAANWVFQFTILSLLITMFQIPFIASIISHENIGVFTIISTIECIGKFIVALSIKYSPVEYLIFYSGGLLFFKMISFISYVIYCKNKYQECTYRRIRDFSIAKELLSFSMWTLFSSLSSMLIFQGGALLINIFFGPLVGGARAISIQVSSAITSFVGAFFMALTPPIVKSYASGDNIRVLKLFNISNVFCYYALLIIVLPAFLETDTILKIWLNISDEVTILFTRAMLLFTFILALNQPITILMRASGYIKEYHLPVEFVLMISFPVTYIFFKLGFAAIFNCYVLIILVFVAHIVRLYVLKKYFNLFSVKFYLLHFLFPAILITLITSCFLFVIHISVDDSIIRLFAVCLMNILLIGLLVFLVGLKKEDRILIKTNISLLLKKK